MSETIKKHIGEGHGKGESYAALAYDSTDAFSGMKIKKIAFADKTETANTDAFSIYINDTWTYVGVASYKSVNVSLTYAPASAGTACPMPIVGKLNLSGNLTAANAYPGMGWGIQGQVDIADGITINDGDYGNGAIYAGIRGTATGTGSTGTFTKGHVTCGYFDMQVRKEMSTGDGEFRTSILYLNAQMAVSLTTIDSAIYISGNVSTAKMVTGIEITNHISGQILKLADDGTIVSVTNGSILNDIHGTANAGFIKVMIGTSDVRYIALYAAKAGA